MIDDNKQSNLNPEENQNTQGNANNGQNPQQNNYNQPNNYGYGNNPNQPNNPNQNNQGGYYYGGNNYQYGNQYGTPNQNNQRPPYNQYGTNNGGYNYSTNQQYNKTPQEDYKWNFEDYDAAAQNAKAKPRKNKGIMVFASILTLILVLGVVVFSGVMIYDYISDGSSDIAPPPISSSTDIGNVPGLSLNDKPEVPDEVLPEGRLTTPQISQKVKPSVVGIAKYEQNNSFQPSSEGSGIIMSSDGYIVTNAHVVENAVGIKVVLNNGEEYTAELIGLDQRTDLAVIKINAQNLSYAEFGNSSQIEIGEKVVAIGNPNGIQASGSVTQGIVSALDRPVKVDRYTMNFIQTDAAINPGNSGGALVNEFGQVIGINSAKMVSQDVEGICFAIPINDAMPIVDELMKNGRVTGRPMLGITGEPIDGIVSRYYGVPMGVHIISVDPASDLSSKGIVPGDIITKINDEEVFSADDISQILDKYKSGDSVKLTVFRQGATKAQDKTFDTNVLLMEAQ